MRKKSKIELADSFHKLIEVYLMREASDELKLFESVNDIKFWGVIGLASERAFRLGVEFGEGKRCTPTIKFLA